MNRKLGLPVPGDDVLERLAATPGLFGRPAGPSAYRLLREIYFDTPDGTLREAGLLLRLRLDAGGEQAVVLTLAEDAVSLQGILRERDLELEVTGGGIYAALEGTSELAARVRALVAPAALRPRLALDIDREQRDFRARLLGKPVRRVAFDRILAHTADGSRAFHELAVLELAPSPGGLEALADHLRVHAGLESDGRTCYDRVLTALGGHRLEEHVGVPRDVRIALLLLRAGEVALAPGPLGLTLPSAPGSGEERAHDLLRDLVGERGAADLDLVGFAPARRGGSDLEVWLFEGAQDAPDRAGLVRIPLMELLERAGAPGLRHPELVSALLFLVRSEIGGRLLREATAIRGAPVPLPFVERAGGVERGSGPEDFLDLELSILDFNQRVLELAEDPGVPLLERFKFLSIFSSNLDEFFVVRAGRLKEEQARDSAPGASLGPAELLDLIQIRVRALVTRQYRCLSGLLLPALEARGVRVRSWADLDEGSREALTAEFERNVFPLLTPLSMAATPGKPFPRLVSLGLTLAVMLERPDAPGGTSFGCVAVPADLQRLVAVPETSDVIPLEEIVAANAAALFPGCRVRDVHVFRVSRIADVDIDEDSSGCLLDAVADQVEARPYKPVVRIEVRRGMPRDLQAYLLRELRAERATDTFALGRGDVYEVEGLLDLRGVAELAAMDLPRERYPALEAAGPLAQGASIFRVIAQGDVLVHHPYHDFDATVGRFLRESAEDPDVVSIRLTLYRTGRSSPVMDALLRALESGKEVSVFVELTARFDEESNIEWTHRLREAGAHVMYGLMGFKTHAKTTLVVRREPGGLRRYVHVGTGNYNATTSRFYTDLGLLSCDEELGSDLNDFFNELTGSPDPPRKATRKLLVAPTGLASAILHRIEREAEHALAGRRARIQAKMNGLADQEVVRALYAASAAGVSIDLVVRSICTLRPEVPGLSERIRVRSILGRFLEHARVFYFENGGDEEYFIGSADWRARNLRKRVEVVAPVTDSRARERLRAILDAELGSPGAWRLRADGTYERQGGRGPTSQEAFSRVEYPRTVG